MTQPSSTEDLRPSGSGVTAPEIAAAPAKAAAKSTKAKSTVGKRVKQIAPWVILLGLAGGGVFAYLRYAEAHKPPDITYKTANVEYKTIVGRATASGTLQATVTVQVGTQVSGRVQSLFADFNSPVKKGQLVAKIDPQLFLAAVAQSRANYLSAQAGVIQAQAKSVDADRVYKRTKALNEQSLASQTDVDTADTNVLVAKAGIDVAKASLAQAQAQLNQNEVNLSYTSITSPIDGVVISRNVDVGQTVASSLSAPVIFTIAEDLRKMQVNTNIAEGDVGRLQPGMAANFSVDAFPGQIFKGTIAQIRNAAQTVQNVVTYDAVINVDNTDLRLRPGMTANVTLIFDTRNHALSVPNAALRFRPAPGAVVEVAASASSSASSTDGGAPRGGGGGKGGRGARGAGGDPNKALPTDPKTLYVLVGGHPSPVSVHVGLSDGTTSEILDGAIKEGDAVITDSTTTAGASPPAAGGAAPTSTRMPKLF